MRLSMEEVQKQHENTKKLYEQGLTVAPVDVKRVLDLYNTIETLQQENERLKGAIQEWVDGVCISQKYLSQIGELQYENERLRAKLDDWKHEVQCHMDEVVARDKEIEKLRAHVARMRDALDEAICCIESGRLCSIGSIHNTYSSQISVSSVERWKEALAEIDKVIGRKEK